MPLFKPQLYNCLCQAKLRILTQKKNNQEKRKESLRSYGQLVECWTLSFSDRDSVSDNLKYQKEREKETGEGEYLPIDH